MSATDLFGAYQPGRSVLHRLPAGAKLGGLAALSLVTVVARRWETSLGLLALAVALLLVARVRVRHLLRVLRGLVGMLGLLAAYQSWQRGPEQAFTVVGALGSLVLLATVLTVTTPVDEIIDVITRLARPLDRFGLRPELVGLAFSLMIRGIPIVLELARETRQAARARGLERNPRAYLTPLVIRVVAHARATGEALHARGVGDD
ncbi:energy-coupling factor transporter transmembrane protein EcfT [Nocardioides zeae]|uniref:Energy-coupling factor transporter transmembrane protein EcfT n=1 Tax=Nocardioides imazamoxiresistens TaxID=3231893 RepID=A0ABU3PRD5_9ACTN|nr:energy-coupling factor transporter transmembrane protein EcfT [Nocardioides zeae]MDT9591763.1 energy-coupling factor transporter transmembrane protein EcfT [Nocardioides zeae]